MKEVEKNEIKRLSDRLDAIRHQQADLSLVEAAEKYAELEKEKPPLRRNSFACVRFRARS
jgi:ribosome-associated protein